MRFIITFSTIWVFTSQLLSQLDYHTINLEGFEGQSRGYYIYVPDEVNLNTPLIFVLHGYSSSASTIMNYSGFNNLAEQNNFIACYPQGTTDIYGNAFFNVGYAFHAFSNVDDVQFIRALSSHIIDEYHLTGFNVFSTGMSNGGDMSYLLACEASDLIRAIAPVAGCMMEWIQDSCNPLYPRSVFEIHGTNDNTTWWGGDYNNAGGWGNYIGVMPTFSFWINLNSCSEFESVELPNNNQSDGSYVISEKYTGGIGGNEVWLYKVINGEHDWPGAYGNMDINSSQEIINFFYRFDINVIIGDTDFDGWLNIVDLLSVSDQIFNQDPFSSVSDINQDGSIDSADLSLIVSSIIGY